MNDTGFFGSSKLVKILLKILSIKRNLLPYLLFIFLFANNLQFSFSENIEKNNKLKKYQFARDYTNEMLLTNDIKLNDFITKVIRSESNFHRTNIGFNETTGLTYDGYSINYLTGELTGVPHVWSAASKESIHLVLLSLAADENFQAGMFVNSKNPRSGKNRALDILQKKISSYEKFNEKYPGFGGFLPRFLVSNEGMKPTAYESRPEWDWQDRIPGLDNGLLAWSLFFTSHILEKKGFKKLAKRYHDYWTMLAKNSTPIFFDPKKGEIRAEVKILDVKQKIITADNYTNNPNVCYLNDPYEGELFVLFMSLFGQWENEEQIKRIWNEKKVTKTEYKTKSGKKITVRWGRWYSSHEMWNFLLLPYRDDQLIKEVFRLGEVARTIYSEENKIPGLFASVNSPPGSYPLNVEYLSAIGIQSLAQMEIESNNVVTPYASFPVIIANKRKGLTWYRTMLAGPRMQGPYGSTEAITVDGRLIAPLVTWESKLTTLLAILNENIMKEMRAALKKHKKYEDFLYYIGKEYKEAFGSIKELKGRDLSIATPSAELPKSIPDFEVHIYKKNGTKRVTEVFRGSVFYGGGNLYKNYKRSLDGTLFIPGTDGYIWNGILHTNLRDLSYINFTVNTLGGKGKGFFLEIKNLLDEMITENKIRVEFPDTKEGFKTFSINISELISNINAKAAIFALSDCNIPLEIKSISFSNTPLKDSVFLSFDGRRFAKSIMRNNRTWNDILARSTFMSGGNIDYIQDESLQLSTSNGWLWSFIPSKSKKIDIMEYKYLYLTVKTFEGSNFMLEIKHKFPTGKEEQILSYYGCNKMSIWIPNTEGEYRTLKIPLRVKKKMKNNSIADVIAISDPRGLLEISQFKLTKK